MSDTNEKINEENDIGAGVYDAAKFLVTAMHDTAIAAAASGVLSPKAVVMCMSEAYARTALNMMDNNSDKRASADDCLEFVSFMFDALLDDDAGGTDDDAGGTDDTGPDEAA